MIKAKFGINEALCHNLCVLIQSAHELGIDASFDNEDAWQYSRGER
jgi:hypothetical protein